MSAVPIKTEAVEVHESAHVYSAISAVQADLSKSGVGKNGKNQQQGFKFRAWDDVQQALSPILARHKVFVVPCIQERECAERSTQRGNTIYHVVLHGEIQFVSGVDGSSFAFPCMGESMDTGDKATSKAITMMVKYGLLHGLQIPLEGAADADRETPEETKITPTAGTWESLNHEEQNFLMEIAERVNAALSIDDVKGAVQIIEAEKLDSDEKVALWTRFNSKQRSAMKKAAKELSND